MHLKSFIYFGFVFNSLPLQQTGIWPHANISLIS